MVRWRVAFVLVAILGLATSARAQPAGDPSAQDEGYWRNWFKRTEKTRAEQPHWLTPLATTTPRLEEGVSVRHRLATEAERHDHPELRQREGARIDPACTKPFTVRVDQRILVDEEPIEFICNVNQQFRRRVKVD